MGIYMNKISSPSFSEKLFNRAGGLYPILLLLFMQIVNTPLLILLTAMLAQQNAEFSTAQGMSLLVVGSIAVLVRNVLLLGQFHLFNKDLLIHLSQIGKTGAVNIYPAQEKRAWRQATTA